MKENFVDEGLINLFCRGNGTFGERGEVIPSLSFELGKDGWGKAVLVLPQWMDGL